MQYFTSSNNIAVTKTSDGWVYATPKDETDGTRTIHLSPDAILALSEFFRAEEDERLGRTRIDGAEGYVAYPEGVAVRVVEERTGISEIFYRKSDEQGRNPVVATAGGLHAAQRYFDAHPEPKPTWHEAKHGEVWAVRLVDADEEIAMRVDGVGHLRFFPISGSAAATTYGLRNEFIDSARRIWPEVSS